MTGHPEQIFFAVFVTPASSLKNGSSPISRQSASLIQSYFTSSAHSLSSGSGTGNGWLVRQGFRNEGSMCRLLCGFDGVACSRCQSFRLGSARVAASVPMVFAAPVYGFVEEDVLPVPIPAVNGGFGKVLTDFSCLLIRHTVSDESVFHHEGAAVLPRFQELPSSCRCR